MKNIPLTRVLIIFLSLISFSFLTACDKSTDDGGGTAKDETAPTFMVPDVEDNNVDSSVPLELNFSEDVKLPSNATDIQVFAYKGIAFDTASLTCDAATYKAGTKKTLSINCKAGMEEASTYKVNVEKIADIAGNIMAGQVVMLFRTIKYPAVIPGTSIQGNDYVKRVDARSQSLYPDITVPFTKKMLASSITAENIVLTEQGSAVSIEITSGVDDFDNTVIYAIPNAVLAINSSYTLTIKGGTGGITDLAGNALQDDFVISIKTRGQADAGLPGIFSIEPRNITLPIAQGQIPVSMNSRFGIAFDEAIDLKSIILGQTITLIDTNQPNATVTPASFYDAKYNHTRNEVVLVRLPGKTLSPETTYTLTMTDAIKDTTGNIFDIVTPSRGATSFTFTTLPDSGDITRPSVILVVPDGRSAVNIDTPIEVTFSEEMNLDSLGRNFGDLVFKLVEVINGVDTALSLFNPTDFVSTSKVINNQTVVSYKPNANALNGLKPGKRYKLIIQTGAYGVADLSMNPLGDAIDAGNLPLNEDYTRIFSTLSALQ